MKKDTLLICLTLFVIAFSSFLFAEAYLSFGWEVLKYPAYLIVICGIIITAIFLYHKLKKEQ